LPSAGFNRDNTAEQLARDLVNEMNREIAEGDAVLRDLRDHVAARAAGSGSAAGSGGVDATDDAVDEAEEDAGDVRETEFAEAAESETAAASGAADAAPLTEVEVSERAFFLRMQARAGRRPVRLSAAARGE
jgi:hypothetical protein